MTQEKQRLGSGHLVPISTPENAAAFIPDELTPKPSLKMDRLYPFLEKAALELGQLQGIETNGSSPHVLMSLYVRKEALVSSHIEGTQATLDDLLRLENNEATNVPPEDAEEISSYIKATHHGKKKINEGMPICGRLIREIHEILLSRGRGANKDPGEFRTSQVRIGGSSVNNAEFVPPPHLEIKRLMADLETFINEKDGLPTLIRAGLAHAQLETIHPFLDGNGRIGRLLIVLFLMDNQLLSSPAFYPSLWFKKRRQDYYNHLQAVRQRADWEGWLEFFLTGMAEAAREAINTEKQLRKLFDDDRRRIMNLGRPGTSALLVHKLFEKKIYLNIPTIVEQLDVSRPTVDKSMRHLQELGIVREITGKLRNKLYAYTNLMDIMKSDTDPI